MQLSTTNQRVNKINMAEDFAKVSDDGLADLSVVESQNLEEFVETPARPLDSKRLNQDFRSSVHNKDSQLTKSKLE